MIKLNNKIYYKMQLQVEEAKEQGMTKLAESVEYAIDNLHSTYYKTQFSSEEMNQNVHKNLWKIATTLVAFHNIESVNIEKIDEVLISWAEKIINDLEKTLQVSDIIKGPLEPKLPGEIK